MRYTKVTIVWWLCMALVTSLAAQPQTSGSNTRLQDTRRWQKDIDKYKDVLQKGDFPAVMEKLADSYRMVGDFEEAEDWYRKSIVNGNQNPTARLNYARTLQTNGKYQEAKSQFILYEEVTGEYEVGEKYIASCDMAMQVDDDKSRYELRPVTELNTPQSDIITHNGKSTMIFATRAKKSEIGTNRQGRNSNGDYDLYTAFKSNKGFADSPKKIKGRVNSKYDDVNAVRMPGSDLLLFTRIGENDDKTGSQSKVTQGSVEILGGRVKGRKIDAIDNLPYNIQDEFANFHPAIHPSGDVIVFASDRPGGYGGVDLYMVRRKGGKWTEPKNLGPEVNTEGDETFPSYNRQGNLFFASDGHVGYGGLDIYTADLERGRYQNVQNMGAGINSSRDDFGVVWDSKRSAGYFNSNRNPDSGDDIYYFRRQPGISGKVTDGLSGDPLPGSIVRMKDVSGNEQIIITDGGGNFSEPVKMNTGYLVTVDAPGYETYRDTIWTRNIPQGRDIRVKVGMKIEQQYELAGRVVDMVADSNLTTATVRIMSNGETISTFPVEADSADFGFQLEANADYAVIFERSGFVPRVKNLAIGNIRGTIRRNTLVPMVPGEYVLVHGMVKEAEGEQDFLPGSFVAIVDNNTMEIIDSTVTMSDGSFYVAVPLDSMTNYSIISARKGFLARSLNIVADSMTSGQEMDMEIALNEARYGLDNNVKVIRYGYNEADLDLISREDLDELYFFLMQNPDAILEVRSFTDSRGTREYNLELSRRRSEAVIEYIQSRRPIADERFVAWGFGEEYPLNQCVDGTQCSEEEHAVNRRTEIKLVER